MQGGSQEDDSKGWAHVLHAEDLGSIPSIHMVFWKLLGLGPEQTSKLVAGHVLFSIGAFWMLSNLQGALEEHLS